MTAAQKNRYETLNAKRLKGPLSPDELMEFNMLLAQQGDDAAKAASTALPKSANPTSSPTAGAGVMPKAGATTGAPTAPPAYVPPDVGDPLNYGLQPQTPGVTPASIARTTAELQSMNPPAGYDPIYAETARIQKAIADKEAQPALTALANPTSSPTALPAGLLKPPASAEPAPTVSKAQKTAVQKLIEGLQAEEKVKDGKPNIWDFIEAGSAGWQGRKAAYLTKQEAEAERAAQLQTLEKTAMYEEALQKQRDEEATKRALVQAGLLSPAALGIEGVGGVGGVNRGQALAAQFAASLGGD